MHEAHEPGNFFYISNVVFKKRVKILDLRINEKGVLFKVTQIDEMMNNFCFLKEHRHTIPRSNNLLYTWCLLKNKHWWALTAATVGEEFLHSFSITCSLRMYY
jgi:hypothetical protein